MSFRAEQRVAKNLGNITKCFRDPFSLRSSGLQNINNMVWIILLVILIAAFAYRIVACIRKSKQSGEEWNLADKYAANDFGE